MFTTGMLFNSLKVQIHPRQRCLPTCCNFKTFLGLLSYKRVSYQFISCVNYLLHHVHLFTCCHTWVKLVWVLLRIRSAHVAYENRCYRRNMECIPRWSTQCDEQHQNIIVEKKEVKWKDKQNSDNVKRLKLGKNHNC